jgi:hypothetical protein
MTDKKKLKAFPTAFKLAAIKRLAEITVTVLDCTP